MNKTKYTIIALMALIVTMSIGVTSFKNASAIELTNAERYQSGLNAATNAGIGIPDYMKVISSVLFQNHSDAYRNGYIAGVDQRCGIKLPYMDYSIVDIHDSLGNPVSISHMMMFQDTAELK